MHKFMETTHHSSAWLKKASDDGTLEMKPPFQRNPVWSDKQKGSLIETMLLEYPIPEIYMQSVVDAEGQERHIIVDGQQRTRAILEFIAGEFEISEEGSQWDGMSFDDLNAADKKKIYEYRLVTRVLPNIPDEQIRAIFQRINRNTVSLNAQELRHATYWGEFIKLVEELADYDFWEGIRIFSANDRRRMLDAEFVSELVVAYLNGLQNKKTKLEDYYQLYENEFDKAAEVKETFRTVMGELEQSFPALSKTRWRKKSDFYTLFLVLAKHRKRLPLSSDERGELGLRLEAFGSDVDAVIGLEEGHNIPETAVSYAAAVERAASDLGARRRREEALDKFLEPVLGTRGTPDHTEITVSE